jgi:hypothetical protein
MGGPERCETRFNNAFPPRCFPPHALLLWDVVSLPYLGRLQKDEKQAQVNGLCKEGNLV